MMKKRTGHDNRGTPQVCLAREGDRLIQDQGTVSKALVGVRIVRKKMTTPRDNFIWNAKNA